MTAIKHTLQREIFLPDEERLIAVVHVTKAGKKKKPSFLCASVTTEKPIQALICQVKKADRGDTFKKKLQWTLRELKQVDARCMNNKDVADFDLKFDNTKYSWTASSLGEKNAFINCLYKLSQRYVVQKPEFKNIPKRLLEDNSSVTETDRSVAQAEELAKGADWEYHALTEKEETDLEGLMAQCDFAISNAEAFAEQLSKDLSVLDGANVHSIMGSEDQVLDLMVLLDKGLQEAIKVEEKLDEYDTKLQSLKDLMDIMKDKDALIQVRNQNHTKLLETLDELITSLDLDQHHKAALTDGDLSTPAGIQECTTAARALQRCISADIPSALQQMTAVQEQQKRFKSYKATFAKRLSHHLNNLFIHQGNELGENLAVGDMRLPKHHSSHRDLSPYADLMVWLKQVEKESFYDKLVKVYTDSISKLYDREIKDFIDLSKAKITPPSAHKKETSSWLVPSPGKSHGSNSSINRTGSLLRQSRDSLHVAHASDSPRGSLSDITPRNKFDQMLEHVLSELGPVCLAEQDFCVRFFYLVPDEQSTADSNSTTPSSSSSKMEIDGFTPQKPDTSKEHKINAEVRKMMGELFPSLEAELVNFIQFGDRLDNFNSLYMLVRMTQHVMNAEDTGSFLNKTYGNCLIHIRRNFDTFIRNQVQAIKEYKTPKKSKIGIIPFVHNFQHFAVTAEHIFKGSDRRNELDRAYQEMLDNMSSQILRISMESVKIPREVVLFENYHHIYDMLSQLKIPCLDGERKEAKHRYQEHMQAYVTSSLGRPMEKLSIFFEGIEAKIAAGVKMEEVSYQLAYSKQELRKNITHYPGKEVKKGLESLCKKVEKHLCEEENLFQVVWHSMQDEFLKQYNHFDNLIDKCYPGSGITLEFTIDDVLAFFQDIAQSH